MKISLLLIVLALQLPVLPAPAAAPVTTEFSDKGLSSLQVGGVEFVATGLPSIQWLTGTDGKPFSQKLNATRFDLKTKSLTMNYTWGDVIYTYESLSDGIRIRVKIKNAGDQTLTGIRWNLLTFLPLGEGKPPQQTVTAQAPAFTFFEGTEGALVLGAENPPFPLTLDLARDPKTKNVMARAGFGGGKVTVDGVQLNDALAPGAEADLTFVIRAAPAGTPTMEMAKDFLDVFRNSYPSLLNWPDRRPILRAFFGGGLSREVATANLKNPDAVVPPAPDEKFQSITLSKIDGLIAAAQAVDAQGLILWDLEGETYPHAITYIGDPRLIRLLNPQMDLIADQIMTKIHDAGLNSGITLRPSRVIYDAEKNFARHSYKDAGDAFSELDGKVAYARQRWGTKIFYVDTNFFWRPYGPEEKWEAGPISEEIWRKLLVKYPDTLFIPEFPQTADYASVPGYGEADMGDYGMPAIAKALYPDAFRVIVIEDADPSENFDRFVAALDGGNVLMTFGQSATAQNVVMIQRMKEFLALQKAPVPEVVKSASPENLLKLLSDSDLPTRFHAAIALGNAPDPANAAPLTLVVQNESENWAVRRAALVALGKLASRDSVPTLFALMEDRKLGLYGDALKALLGQDESVDAMAIEKIRSAPSGQMRPEIYERFGDLLVSRKAASHAKDIQDVFLQLEEKEAWNKKLLLGVIGGLKNPESNDFLLPMLDDPGFGPFAATAIVRIGSPESIAKVKETADAAKAAGNKELAAAYGRALQAK